ncbi:MAG: hypothetical protein ACUVX8_00770 [Candidatus Zipacnadales bacterium]
MAENSSDLIDKLLRLDRRIIFVLIAVAVTVPLATKVRLDPGSNPRSKAVYDHIESLPKGSVVVICFDYGPSSMPELQPMAIALIRHALQRGLRVIGMTLAADAPILVDSALNRVGRELGKRDGVDYVNLGFNPGGTAVVLQMGSDIGSVFRTDFKGRRFGDLEVTRGVRTYRDIGLLVDLASSNTPDLWVIYAYERYKDQGVKIAAGVTAVMAQDYYPYLQSGQLIGLLNGMKGAAEYEKLVDAPGDGMGGMVAQSYSQFLIVTLVIFGNIVYFISRRRAHRVPRSDT